MKQLHLKLSKLVSQTLIWGCILSGSWFLAKPAFANLFLSPLYLELEAQGGRSKGVIVVGNTSEKPIQVRLSSTAFTYKSDGNFQSLPSGEPNDLTPYLRYSPREISIPPKSSRQVRLISLLPPNLPKGEYRVAIFAKTLQEVSNSQGYKIAYNTSVGSAIYVRKGDLSPNLNIRTANFNQDNKQLRILVGNSGEATARAKINWYLKQGGNQIAAGTSGGSFLPGSQINILLNRTKETANLTLQPGSYQLTGEIEWKEKDNKKSFPFNMDLKI